MGKDITGKTFGRLTAVGKATPLKWTFYCECGVTKAINRSSVTGGLVRSCGCLRTERNRSGLNPLRHGHARAGKVTRLHNIWRGMLKRVDAKIGEAHKKYASRGIKVCAEWRAFEPFRDWAMANGYEDNLTIDRRDNDGDYCPSNCHWTTRKVQCRNRRSSRRLAAFGKDFTMAEWAEKTGLRAATISARISCGWDHESALSKPLRK